MPGIPDSVTRMQNDKDAAPGQERWCNFFSDGDSGFVVACGSTA